MIGWRPYLLTGLALVLLAVVALDVVAAGRPAEACRTADGMRSSGQLVKADQAYAAVLQDDASSRCAKSGRRLVAQALCQRINAVGDDASERRKRFLALATADPKPPDESCVWSALASLGPFLAPK
jgi:hypothetical protein